MFVYTVEFPVLLSRDVKEAETVWSAGARERVNCAGTANNVQDSEG